MSHKYYLYYSYFQNGVHFQDILCVPKVSVIKNRIRFIKQYGTDIVYFYKRVW